MFFSFQSGVSYLPTYHHLSLPASRYGVETPSPVSPNPRQHNEPLLLIASAKLAAILGLFLARPQAHGHQRGSQKQHRAPTPRHQRNADPSQRLEHVIWTRDQAEPPAARDAALGGAAAAESAQHEVRVQVTEFADEENGEGGVGDVRV